ncbi:hypothetical protein EJ05DRAFT_110215 [Pseudovirgaria hyperparasitica]|uniref:Secreted protein n=1 Tax=Pseudovirgaria hyperparasitica TaxID=470096 RepID=A0A6A6W0N6_9PEZI|nr:uncharacterized protein EJ05DRAFT_110215 [Pseudovirgaria hyperparasitica]KAF2755656.1 hypothetical protein EJ05DRAFT_110215 [Pseudovirgaria hyperparasitica]
MPVLLTLRLCLCCCLTGYIICSLRADFIVHSSYRAVYSNMSNLENGHCESCHSAFQSAATSHSQRSLGTNHGARLRWLPEVASSLSIDGCRTAEHSVCRLLVLKLVGLGSNCSNLAVQKTIISAVNAPPNAAIDSDSRFLMPRVSCYTDIHLLL